MKAFIEIDMTASMALFALFMVFTSAAIADNIGKYKSAVYDDIRESDARNIANFILFSPGQPVNWNKNTSNVTELGLSYYYDGRSYPSMLDFKKVNALSNVSYGLLKNFTGSKDIKIIIQDITFNKTYSFGSDSQRKALTSVERYVALRYSLSNISKAKMTVMIWN